MKLLFTLLPLLWSANSFAQVSFSPQTINFQSQVPGSPETVQITLNNQFDFKITIDSITTGKHFGENAFSFTGVPAEIDANAQASFNLVFEPKHNITHRSQLMIYTSNRGTFSAPVVADATASMNAYSFTNNLSGEALKSELIDFVTDNHTQQLGYNQGRDVMYMTSDNQSVNGNESTNTLEGVYTGTVITGYNNRQAAQNMGFNTEHTFPQSFFNSDFPMRGDIHHLFPTKQQSNSARANYPFGVVTNNPTYSEGGSLGVPGLFEPRDKQKGPTARAMMYFVLRYGDYNNFYNQQEGILLEWNQNHAPTTFDQNRNDAIESAQGNRNPFVDYPQFAQRMKTLAGNADLDPIEKLILSNDEIDNGIEQNHTRYALSLRNDGNTAIDITGFDLDTTYVAYRNTPQLPLTLQAGEGLQINLFFKPADLTEVDELFTIETTAGNYTANLKADFGVMSVNNIKSKPLHLYPNPVRNTLNFSSTVNRVTVYEITGKKLIESQNTNSLNLESIGKGLFLVRTEYNGSTKIHKIVR